MAYPYDDPYKDIFRIPQLGNGLSQPLAPAEEDDLLSRLVGGGLTGLQWVGDLLDKTFGGRAVRGLLGGRPEEALSIIPLSDTLGLTDRKNRVSGEDLLGADTGSETMDSILGIGAEIALDPALYLSLGGSALTKAGVAAKKLGVLPKTLAGRISGFSQVTPELAAAASRMGVNASELVGRPLGGLAGFKLPWAESGAVLGTGNVGQRVAGLLGGAKDYLTYTSPGRTLGALFDTRVNGLSDPFVQRALRESDDARKAAMVAARDEVGRVFQSAPPGYDKLAMRESLENIPQVPLAGPAYAGVTAQTVPMLEQERLAREALGLPSTALADRHAGYFPRYPGQLERSLSQGQQNLDVRFSGMQGRTDPFRDVPGGTAEIERILKSGQIQQFPASAGEIIAGQHFGVQPGLFGFQPDDFLGVARMGRQGSVGVLSPAMEEAAFRSNKAFELGKRVLELEPARVGPTGTGMFSNDPFVDLLGHMEAGTQSVGHGQVIHDVLSSPNVLRAGIEAAARGEAVSTVADVLTRANFKPEALDLVGMKILNTGYVPGIPIQSAADVAKQAIVPMSTANDLSALRNVIREGDALSAPLRAVDSATAVTKAMQTAPWPAFNVRNLLSSTWQSAARGSGLGGLMEGGGIMEVLRRGEVPPGLAAKLGEADPLYRGLSDAQAAQELGREMFAHRAAGRGLAQMWQHGGNAQGGSIAHLIPGGTREPSLAEALGSYVKGRRDPVTGAQLDTIAQRATPWNVSGFGGFAGLERRNVDQFAPVVGGRQLGELIDDLTRGGQYVERRMSGYAPAAATAETAGSHFDYGKMTDFERKVMRRLVPFYAWQRGNIPEVLSQLVQRPGGLSGQGIRVLSDARGEETFLPAYLGMGSAVPLGPEEGGIRRFLTRTDLPFEDVAAYATPMTPQRMLERLAGQLNPLIKGPLELATGRQFFANRELSDLYSQTGSAAADQAIMNSPLARLFTTAMQVSDSRKDPLARLVNLGTGFKVSDVDLDKQRTIAIRDLLADYMKGSDLFRQSVNYHVPAEMVHLLSPEEQQVVRLSRQLNRQPKR